MICQADARRLPFASGSMHCCVTSPPYFALRDYGVAGQLGLEPTPDAYVAAMVGVFREVWRVLRDDGTLWLNIGDSYANTGGHTSQGETSQRKGRANVASQLAMKGMIPAGFKQKDLMGIPWLLAFALRADGWYLRSEIIWAKPNVMPESVVDRPSKMHEQVFLLTKRPKYFYDIEAVKENVSASSQFGRSRPSKPVPSGIADGVNDKRTSSRLGNGSVGDPSGRNCRSVWTIPTAPFKGSHFAVMPPKLAMRCIKAGTSEKGCCPACGVQWKRLVERVRYATRPGLETKVVGNGERLESGVVGNRDPGRHVTATRTVGWTPGCRCDPGLEPEPSRVFDPFGGAMTTVLAAEVLGRRGYAAELKREYALMGKLRVERPHAPSRTPARRSRPRRPRTLFPDMEDN